MIHDLYHDNVFFLPPQMPLLMAAIGIGAAFGIFLAMNRALLHCLPGFHLVFAVCDCFGVLAAHLLLFSASLDFNTGIIRWYDAVAFLAGSLMTYCAVKGPVIFLTEYLFRFMRLVSSILVRPIRLFLSVLRKIRRLLHGELKKLSTIIRMELYCRSRLHEAASGFCITHHE